MQLKQHQQQNVHYEEKLASLEKDFHSLNASKVSGFSYLVMNTCHFFFKNFIFIYRLNIQIQISLVIGNLYSADLITGISSIKKMNE